MPKFNLKIFDLCGSIVGLVYKGQRRYKSFIGGLLSMLLIAAIFCVIVIHLNDFFSRTKAKMSFDDLKYNTPPYLNLTTNFNFIMMLQFKGINDLRQDVLTISAHAKIKENNVWRIHPIEKIPCKPNEQISLKLFERLELDKGRCFNMSGVSLNASNANDFYQYIEIKVSLCTDDPSCLSKNEIIDTFAKEKPVAVFYFIDSAFQVYDSRKRMTNFYNNHDCNLTYTNIKESFLLFSLNEMQVDENYFFPGSPINHSGYMIESMRQTGAVRAEGDIDLLYINLQSSKFKTVTYVSYMQLSELLANICAFINIFIMVFCSLGNYFNHFFFQSDLTSSFYDMNEEDESLLGETRQKIISIKQHSRQKKFNLNLNIGMNINTNNLATSVYNNKNLTNLQLNRSGQNVQINTSDQSLNILETLAKNNIKLKKNNTNKIINHKNALKIMFTPFFPCFTSTKTKDLQLKISYANKSLLFYQDLKNLYRKLLEIDLMKYLLLTEEQLALYQIVPKPIFKKPNGSEGSKEFASLVNHPHFHFLKSKRYIREIVNTPKYKSLFASRVLNSPIDNNQMFYQKIMNLIT